MIQTMIEHSKWHMTNAQVLEFYTSSLFPAELNFSIYKRHVTHVTLTHVTLTHVTLTHVTSVKPPIQRVKGNIYEIIDFIEVLDCWLRLWSFLH